jgi:hypothetical protein
MHFSSSPCVLQVSLISSSFSLLLWTVLWSGRQSQEFPSGKCVTWYGTGLLCFFSPDFKLQYMLLANILSTWHIYVVQTKGHSSKEANASSLLLAKRGPATVTLACIFCLLFTSFVCLLNWRALSETLQFWKRLLRISDEMSWPRKAYSGWITIVSACCRTEVTVLVTDTAA